MKNNAKKGVISMEIDTFSHEDLMSVIRFLAKEKNISPEDLIFSILKRIDEEKTELSNIMNKISQLDKSDQDKLKIHINDVIERSNQRKNCLSDPKSLQYLSVLDTEELVKTSPKILYINNDKFFVKTWAEATDIFVKRLIDDKYVTKDILPFFNSDKTSKAYINNTNKHQNEKDGVFHKIYDGFYVDIKYNAKYHILNMLRTLNKLSVQHIYDIKIQF